MKKNYIALLTAALLISSLTACRTETTRPDPPSSVQDTEEQLLMDESGVSVYAVGWNQENSALEMRVKNTSTQDYILQAADTSVNHYMMDPSFSLNISAGSETETTLSFPSDLMDECGIQTVSRIETKLVLLDGSSFETLYLSDTITIPTDASDSPQTYDDSGELLYEENGLKLVSKGIADDPVFGKCWKVYISNDSEQDIHLEPSHVALNGCEIDVLFSATVPKGKKAIASMTIFREDLEKYNITSVESMDFSLQILDPSTYETRQTLDNLHLSFQS